MFRHRSSILDYKIDQDLLYYSPKKGEIQGFFCLEIEKINQFDNLFHNLKQLWPVNRIFVQYQFKSCLYLFIKVKKSKLIEFDKVRIEFREFFFNFLFKKSYRILNNSELEQHFFFNLINQEHHNFQIFFKKRKQFLSLVNLENMKEFYFIKLSLNSIDEEHDFHKIISYLQNLQVQPIILLSFTKKNRILLSLLVITNDHDAFNKIENILQIPSQCPITISKIHFKDFKNALRKKQLTSSFSFKLDKLSVFFQQTPQTQTRIIASLLNIENSLLHSIEENLFELEDELIILFPKNGQLKAVSGYLEKYYTKYEKIKLLVEDRIEYQNILKNTSIEKLKKVEVLMLNSD